MITITKIDQNWEAMMLTIHRLDLDDAITILDGAQAHAETINVPMCIAVVDDGGYLIAFRKMNGGKPLSTTLAQDKAFTAAVSKRPTSDYNAIAVPGNLANGIQNACNSRFQIMGGGIPVEVAGDIVGGIGISGGTPDQDIICAEAGLHAFLALSSD